MILNHQRDDLRQCSVSDATMSRNVAECFLFCFFFFFFFLLNPSNSPGIHTTGEAENTSIHRLRKSGHFLLRFVSPGECPYLYYPKNGRRVGYAHLVGDKAVFKCNTGYSLRGSSERTCQMNREWDGETTRCVGKSAVMLTVYHSTL